jgi:hypothetical protein
MGASQQAGEEMQNARDREKENIEELAPVKATLGCSWVRVVGRGGRTRSVV